MIISTAETSSDSPHVFLIETFYVKLLEKINFFKGTWLLLFLDTTTSLSTSFDIVFFLASKQN